MVTKFLFSRNHYYLLLTNEGLRFREVKKYHVMYRIIYHIISYHVARNWESGHKPRSLPPNHSYLRVYLSFILLEYRMGMIMLTLKVWGKC